MCWLCVDYVLTMCWLWVDYVLTMGWLWVDCGLIIWLRWLPALVAPRASSPTTYWLNACHPPDRPNDGATAWMTDQLSDCLTDRQGDQHTDTHTRTPKNTHTHAHTHTHLQTSLDKKVVSLDGRNSRGLTNTKGTVEGVNIKTLGNIVSFSKKYMWQWRW